MRRIGEVQNGDTPMTGLSVKYVDIWATMKLGNVKKNGFGTSFMMRCFILFFYINET